MTELAVLVPVLNRPQNVAPLVESFLAGCPEDSYLLFIMEYGDITEGEAVAIHHDWKRVFSRVTDAHTWPEKINDALRPSAYVGQGPGKYRDEAAWYLLAADDISFTPGWWEATEHLRADPHICVIGTNDSANGTGNPAVAEGTHTCHPLIRASYIRDYGTWDEPGKAVHEGYHHWFVDNEIVITAKMRRCWAFCREAVLEHNHPYWRGGAGWDATYALGEANAEADKQLWFKRAAQFGPLQPYPEDDPRCPH